MPGLAQRLFHERRGIEVQSSHRLEELQGLGRLDHIDLALTERVLGEVTDDNLGTALLL